MSPALLVAEGVRRAYPTRGRSRRGSVVAVDGVDLELGSGECLGLVGESGSGKSTLARLLLALERPDRGSVTFAGHRISHLPASAVRPLRRRLQAVFQDPTGSLDPRLRVATTVAEPLLAHRLGDRAARLRRVHEVLQLVGLPDEVAERRPSGLSSGQCQRAAIARALATEPELLVLDEPLSSLDAPTQARILALLSGLRRRLGIALLLISHDLEVVRGISDRVAVMYRGRVVEEGATSVLLARPAHPYTRALLAAAPGATPAWLPTPAERPADGVSWTTRACRYAPRCPQATAECQREPELLAIADDHHAACWFARSEGQRNTADA